MTSQLAQDQWVIEKLGEKPGFFVEVGAFDGITGSNTLGLEQQYGWNGILIEADPARAEASRASRTAKVIQSCVGPYHDFVDFFIANQWSGIRSMTRRNILDEHLRRGNPTVRMRTEPLQNLLFNTTPAVIDYLSIDVEGAEYRILHSYFQACGVPHFRLLTVEIGTNQDELDKLVKLLIPLGYRLDRIERWDAFFYHKDLI